MNNIDRFALLLQYLEEKDIDNFKLNLKLYLTLTNNIKYEKLLNDLLNIDIIINNDFELIKQTLDSLHNNEFKLKRTNFVKNYFKMLNENLFDKASLYLEVIGDLEDIKEEHHLYKKLKIILNEKKDEIDHDEVYESYKYSGLDFLDESISELRKERGIVLLKEMNYKERQYIHNLIKKIPDVISFSIGNSTEKRIVLCYVSKTYQPELIRELLGKSKKAYLEKNTFETIELCKDILDLGCGYALVFARIGISYLRENNKEEALKYLEVANDLAIKDKLKNNYSLILENIRGNKKTISKLNEDNFNDIEENYGIKNLNNILYLIYEKKYNLEEVCLEYGLSEPEINIVRLICAKEEFINLNDNKGNKLLKQVEKSKEKNKKVLELFKEVLKNKKFYKNRTNKENSVVKLALERKNSIIL